MEFRGKKIQELDEPIVLKSYNNRQQPVKISPPEDKISGRIFTGQGKADGFIDSISEEDRKKMGYFIGESTVISITNGKVLNPNSITDKENWRWMQLHPYISLDHAAGKSSRHAVFYVENKKVDAERRVTLARTKDKARYMIQFDMSHEQQVNVAKTIGHPSPEAFSSVELTDYLLNQCETIAAAIIEAANPANAESSAVQLTFHELVRWKVIEKYRGGTFKFNGPEGTFMGHNETKVMEFLKLPKNTEIVAAILAQLEDKKEALKVAGV